MNGANTGFMLLATSLVMLMTPGMHGESAYAFDQEVPRPAAPA
jgi:hypothetical protein